MKFLRQQFLALVVGRCDGQLGLALLDLGRRQLVVELDEELTFAHTVTIAKVQLRHAPADFGAQDDALT